MRAWNLMSFTPAISSVDLKYLSAESPPRFLKLYTKYLTTRREVKRGKNGTKIEMD